VAASVARAPLWAVGRSSPWLQRIAICCIDCSEKRPL